jgi:hypothetical protein
VLYLVFLTGAVIGVTVIAYDHYKRAKAGKLPPDVPHE